MIIRGYGKINLTLDVLRRREDGYHDLRMIMQSVDLFDEITLDISNAKAISMTCNIPNLPTDDTNLVIKAAKSIFSHCGINRGLTIHLDKHIPMAAGMAGGSADAAAVLVGINELFGLGLTLGELKSLGVTLGADIPFCIQGGTCLSEGIGDILTPLPEPPECYIVIAKPSIDVSTGFVYRNLKLTAKTQHPDVDGMINCLNNGDLQGLCRLTGNVLATVTEPAFPQIVELKNYCLSKGAMSSLMTGSGPTVFAIFDNPELANKCIDGIKASYSCDNVELTHFKARGVEIIQP